MLTDEQCREIWDSGEKIVVDSPEGKEIMKWLMADTKKNAHKQVWDRKLGING